MRAHNTKIKTLYLRFHLWNVYIYKFMQSAGFTLGFWVAQFFSHPWSLITCTFMLVLRPIDWCFPKLRRRARASSDWPPVCEILRSGVLNVKIAVRLATISILRPTPATTRCLERRKYHRLLLLWKFAKLPHKLQMVGIFFNGYRLIKTVKHSAIFCLK